MYSRDRGNSFTQNRLARLEELSNTKPVTVSGTRSKYARRTHGPRSGNQ